MVGAPLWFGSAFKLAINKSLQLPDFLDKLFEFIVPFEIDPKEVLDPRC